MAKKSFKAAPQAKQPTPEQVAAFTKGGAGTDKASDEPTKRLSLDLPMRTHTRFKTACSATGRKMVSEIQDFIEWRTKELEKEAGIALK
jgi:hypothetical protein